MGGYGMAAEMRELTEQNMQEICKRSGKKKNSFTQCADRTAWEPAV